MKKWLAALPAALLLLLPQHALADAANALDSARMAERSTYLWVLGVCSVLFVLLVCIWSVMLKRSAKKNPPKVARARK